MFGSSGVAYSENEATWHAGLKMFVAVIRILQAAFYYSSLINLMCQFMIFLLKSACIRLPVSLRGLPFQPVLPVLPSLERDRRVGDICIWGGAHKWDSPEARTVWKAFSALDTAWPHYVYGIWGWYSLYQQLSFAWIWIMYGLYLHWQLCSRVFLPLVLFCLEPNLSGTKV